MAYEFPPIQITSEEDLSMQRLSGEHHTTMPESKLLHQAEKDILVTGVMVARKTGTKGEEHQFADGSTYACYATPDIPTDEPGLALRLEARGNFRENGVEPASLLISSLRTGSDAAHRQTVLAVYGAIHGQDASVLHGRSASKEVEPAQYRDVQQVQNVLHKIALAAGIEKT